MVKTTFRFSVEQMLAATLALLFVMPLCLTTIRNVPVSGKVSRWLDRQWLGQPAMSGVTVPAADVPLTFGSLRNGEFQKRLSRQFNEGFAGREALIRWTNEIWFRLFHDTANPGSNIVVGKDDALFERFYLEEYFLARTEKSTIEPWVRNLRELQDLCRGIGMGFVVVVAPSKASIYPEEAPAAWRRWHNPRPRAYVLLTQLLRENGIVFVDGVDLVTQEKRKAPPAPLFSKGGIHWNRRAGLITANAVQARFAEQNKPATQIESLGSIIDNRPAGEENDLVNLMNLARPWKFPCERIKIKPSAKSKAEQMTMAMVGDSFSWSLLDVLNESRQFSEIGFFFHYWRFKARLAGGPPKIVRTPASPLDFKREIFAADCLLLEIDETVALGPEHHLSAFIRDALAHRADAAVPRPAFRAD